MDATILQSFSVFSRVSSTDAASRIDLDELAETEDDFVNLLRELTSRRHDDSLAIGWFGID